uniref:Fibronectin type-III domain-containing protein n=1 Tax=Denticeps clupeoides TaxID=299321 RepID=A0AAY4ATK0_9TELE
IDTFVIFSVVILAEVRPPENVRIASVNLGLQLEWNAPANASGLLTYTTEYRGEMMNYTSACANQMHLKCDITGSITPFGVYSLRVRAERDREVSDWVEIKGFQLDLMTNISAPGLHVSSRNGEVNVQITNPEMRVSTLQDVYSPVEYLISFWKEGQPRQVSLRFRSEVKLLTLPMEYVMDGGRYCVEVSSFFIFLNKTTFPSNISCVTMAKDSELTNWAIFWALLASFGVVGTSVVLIFLAGWQFFKCIRYLHPKAKLPEHFKQVSVCVSIYRICIYSTLFRMYVVINYLKKDTSECIETGKVTNDQMRT